MFIVVPCINVNLKQNLIQLHKCAIFLMIPLHPFYFNNLYDRVKDHISTWWIYCHNDILPFFKLSFMFFLIIEILYFYITITIIFFMLQHKFVCWNNIHKKNSSHIPKWKCTVRILVYFYFYGVPAIPFHTGLSLNSRNPFSSII